MQRTGHVHAHACPGLDTKHEAPRRVELKGGDRAASGSAKGGKDASHQSVDVYRELVHRIGRSSLKSLNLCFNDICERGAGLLADALPRSQLRSLNISFNRVGPGVPTATRGARYTLDTHVRSCPHSCVRAPLQSRDP